MSNQLPLFEPKSDWQAPERLPVVPDNVILAVDTETRDDGLNQKRGPGWVFNAGYICGVSVAWDDQAYYIPVRHPDSPNFPTEEVFSWLEDAMLRAKVVVFHNEAYDRGWLSTEHVVVPEGKTDDTYVMAVMCDENRMSYSLDACCKWRGVPGKDESLLREAAATFGVDAKSEMWKLPARHVGPYATQDAVATLHLRQNLIKEIERQSLEEAYRLEMDLIPMVMAMRRRGIRVNEDTAERIQRDLRAQRDSMLEEIRGFLGWRSISMDDLLSPRSLERAFDQEGIQYPKTPKTGRGSFKSDWMSASNEWLPKAVVWARQHNDMAEKFIGTYILDSVHNGRIHAEVHQLRDDDGGTRSYRFSYSNPPLQQIPARGELGLRIRTIFEPERGQLWLSSDYCFDDRTEILTEEGWKLFADLNRKERVAQWHNDGSLSWVHPTDYYVGEDRMRDMVHVLGPRKTDFMVTPEHDCIVGGRRVKARDLGATVAFSELPYGGVLPAEGRVDPALIKLLVALQADAADRSGTWRFYLSREDKKRRLVEILETLGWDYQYKEKANGDKDAFVIGDRPEIREFLSDGKVFNRDRLLGLTPDLRRVFCEELAYWDGSRGPLDGSRWNYGTTVRVNAETASIIGTVSGFRVIERFDCSQPDGRKDFHVVSFYTDHGKSEEHARVNRVRYRGKVFCVTVPTHSIVVKRNGRVVVSGQSQQEPRLAVHFAALCKLRGSQTAVDYYFNNEDADFHTMVASITGVPRKVAKILNLGLMYGMGLAKLATSLGIDEDSAKEVLIQYHTRMPFVQALTEFCSQRANVRGYIRLLDGARSHFDDWEGSHNRGMHYKAPRSLEAARAAWPGQSLRRAFTHKAMNRLIQGSAARQTKLAMRACWREGIVPLIQLHDELGSSVSSQEEADKICALMRDVVPLRVPMKVDGALGFTWGAASVEPPKGVAAPSFEEVTRFGRTGTMEQILEARH